MQKQPGCRTLGSLTKEVVSTLEVVGSTPPKSLVPSATTGCQSLVTTQNLIGAVLGRPGAGTLSDLEAAYPEETPLQRAERLLNSKQTRHGRSWPNAMDRGQVLQVLAGGNRAERDALTLTRIQALLSNYFQMGMVDSVHKMVLGDWLEALQPYPYHAIETACKRWLGGDSRHKRPQVGDIVELAGLYGRHFVELERRGADAGEFTP